MKRVELAWRGERGEAWWVEHKGDMYLVIDFGRYLVVWDAEYSCKILIWSRDENRPVLSFAEMREVEKVAKTYAKRYRGPID